MGKIESNRRCKEKSNPWANRVCGTCSYIYKVRSKTTSSICRSCRPKKNRYTIKCLSCDKEVSAKTSKKIYCNHNCAARHYLLEIKKDPQKHNDYKEKRKIYSINNKDAALKRHKNRYHSDINYRLQANLRTRLHSALRGSWKNGSAVSDLGCSIEFLKEYLENQFTEGMTWDNYPEWHIDHIVPISCFDLTNHEELMKACHYTNLQPLWAKDNIIKRDNIYTKEAPYARTRV